MSRVRPSIVRQDVREVVREGPEDRTPVLHYVFRAVSRDGRVVAVGGTSLRDAWERGQKRIAELDI